MSEAYYNSESFSNEFGSSRRAPQLINQDILQLQKSIIYYAVETFNIQQLYNNTITLPAHTVSHIYLSSSPPTTNATQGASVLK